MRAHIGKILGATSALLLIAATPAVASIRTNGGTRSGVVSSHPRSTRHVDPAPAGPLGTATFAGKVVNLAKSWDGAKACAVFSNGAAECFASRDAMNAALGTDPTPGAFGQPSGNTAQVRRQEALVKREAQRAARSHLSVARTNACEGNGNEWFYMFSGQNYGGQELAVQAPGIWYHLSDFGFGNMLASYVNGTDCYVYLQQYLSGGASLNSPPYNYSPYLGSDQDILNYVYIA